jgi:hypothetical protein
LTDLNTITELLRNQLPYVAKNGCHGLTEEQRFISKIQYTETCWLWCGGKKAAGYGHFGVKRSGRWGKVIAHRHAYEIWVGPIPSNYEIDHLCHTRGCVRPDHLQAVTVTENRARRDKRVDLCVHDPTLTRGPWDDMRYRCRKCGRMLS